MAGRRKQFDDAILLEDRIADNRGAGFFQIQPVGAIEGHEERIVSAAADEPAPVGFGPLERAVRGRDILLVNSYQRRHFEMTPEANTEGAGESPACCVCKLARTCRALLRKTMPSAEGPTGAVEQARYASTDDAEYPAVGCDATFGLFD